MKSGKLLASVVSLVILSGCETKFKSMEQAQEACNEWRGGGDFVDDEKELSFEEKRDKYKRENPEPYNASGTDNIEYRVWRSGYLDYTDSKQMEFNVYSSRICFNELMTKQMLGKENAAIKNGTWRNEVGMRGEYEIVKHFRY